MYFEIIMLNPEEILITYCSFLFLLIQFYLKSSYLTALAVVIFTWLSF